MAGLLIVETGMILSNSLCLDYNTLAVLNSHYQYFRRSMNDNAPCCLVCEQTSQQIPLLALEYQGVKFYPSKADAISDVGLELMAIIKTQMEIGHNFLNERLVDFAGMICQNSINLFISKTHGFSHRPTIART